MPSACEPQPWHGEEDPAAVAVYYPGETEAERRRGGRVGALASLPRGDMAAGPWEVLETDLGCPEATEELPGQAGSAQRRPRKDVRKDADVPGSSDRTNSRAHGLEEEASQLAVSEEDRDEHGLSMPEPAPLGADKKAVEKKRAEKVGAKSSTSVPPVPKSLPVKREVEPQSLDPAEEPLIWEGLTLNKCILVASFVALLSVSFQVLQAPCSREGISSDRQAPPPPPPPLHEVIDTEEDVPEVVAAPPVQPESSLFEDSDGDDDKDDDSDADSNLAKPWIFKKWFGRLEPEDKEEEPEVEPEEPPAKVEVRKSREKPRGPERKEEKPKESRVAQTERSSRKETRPKDRAPEDKAGRAPRAPKEPEQQPYKKRGREGKEGRREGREREEHRKDEWKGRPAKADREDNRKRDWRQQRGEQKGKKPWEHHTSTPGKDGTARPREGKKRD
ncbi:junctional sarcoplasmic reticulum protein 1 isoform X2 [Dromaius novaehollandiae]|uniref:junctional sarcoplasmic reticulum protein 1 isoform X2 n=1 Tax=Dromaius novaehollandiae TaxID=8790 RepID=UPI000E1E2FF2|nr:junctional sarcoplasmic reticulum protein 1 isoform X5 [Dromaius novaehollandiae]